MQDLIKQFLDYIKISRGLSPRTAKAYNHDLQKFVGYLAVNNKFNVSEITKNDIDQFLIQMARTGYKKPNMEITRARKLSSIKSFCKYLVDQDILPNNPAEKIEKIKIPQREPDYLTIEEYQKLLSTIRDTATPYYRLRDIAIVTLFLATGIRLSELVGLTLENIKLKDKLIKVKGKGNKERIVPLNKEVASVLEEYLKDRPIVESNSFFISRKSNGLSHGSVYHLVKGYMKEADLNKEKTGVHSLRHTFGASLINTGANLVVIQTLLGHKNLETTRRYLHINNIDLRKAVDQIIFN